MGKAGQESPKLCLLGEANFYPQLFCLRPATHLSQMPQEAGKRTFSTGGEDTVGEEPLRGGSI